MSNTDGKHSFVFYGCENPLYGNQWRFECDWKIVDGVPYICNDTNYNWSSVENYTSWIPSRCLTRLGQEPAGR